MKLGIRGKLFWGAATLALTVAAVSNLYLQRELEDSLIQRIETELYRHTEALRARIEANQLLVQPEKLQVVAKEVARAAQARVSIISATGRLLADSELDQQELSRASNHAGRPEVRSAIRLGFGKDQRLSATIDSPMLYLALPIDAGGKLLGVARVAAPVSQINAALGRLRNQLLFANGLSLLAALVLALFAAHWLSRSLRRFAQAARRIAQEGGGRVPIYSHDEIGHIGRSMNRLLQDAETSIRDLAEENRQLSATLQRIEQGVVTLDPQGKITFANDRALKLLGLGKPARGQQLPVSFSLPQGTSLLEEHQSGTNGKQSAHRVLSGFGVGQAKWLAEQEMLSDSGAKVLLLRQI